MATNPYQLKRQATRFPSHSKGILTVEGIDNLINVGIRNISGGGVCLCCGRSLSVAYGLKVGTKAKIAFPKNLISLIQNGDRFDKTDGLVFKDCVVVWSSSSSWPDTVTNFGINFLKPIYSNFLSDNILHRRAGLLSKIIPIVLPLFFATIHMTIIFYKNFNSSMFLTDLLFTRTITGLLLSGLGLYSWLLIPLCRHSVRHEAINEPFFVWILFGTLIWILSLVGMEIYSGYLDLNSSISIKTAVTTFSSTLAGLSAGIIIIIKKEST